MLITSPISVHSGSSKVAAMPIACGNTVAYAGARDSVQALVPPVVFGNAQPRDGAAALDQLRGFFLERHARHEVVDAALDRELRVFVCRWILGFLRE